MWVLTLGVYMPRHISMAICVCQVNTVHIYCDLLGPSVQSVQHVTMVVGGQSVPVSKQGKC